MCRLTQAIPKCEQNSCTITWLLESVGVYRPFSAVAGVISGDSDFFLMIPWKHGTPL